MSQSQVVTTITNLKAMPEIKIPTVSVPISCERHRAMTPDPVQPRESREREFARLLAANERRLSAYILTLVPNLSDAEEISQETHVRLWEERYKYDKVENFTAWAIRVAYFEVLTWRKRQQRQRLVFDDRLLDELSKGFSGHAEEFDARHDALLRCLSELSEKSRSLLSRVYSNGEKIADIAAADSRSAAAIYKVVQRLRLMLRNCIEQRITEVNT